MPDVDVKNQHPAFLFEAELAGLGVNFPHGFGGPALSLNFSSYFCSLSVSLHQLFIYELTASRSSARCCLLFQASRPSKSRS